MKITDDHVVSLQLGTSKSDVYIKLQASQGSHGVFKTLKTS